MRKKLKRISCLLLVMLCVASFSIPAFAAETDSTDSTEPTELEIEYSYVVGEDGSITITVGDVTTEETVSIGTVVTNGGRLNLRTGAGMDYEIIDQLRPGEEVTVIGTEGDWYEVIVPEKHGYVHSNYLEVLEKAQQNSEIDAATLQLIMQMILQNMTETVPDTDTDADTDTDTETGKPAGALTPDGNLTLIDDYLQIEVEATEDTDQKEKQFITLQSKNGNYFYLVIDRSGDTENVYFLNLIDEADLMALINDETVGLPSCTCDEKCVVGSINTDCAVCRSNMSECCGTETVVEPEPTETEPVIEEPDEDTSSANVLPVVILIIAAGAGGAVYWFKFKKDKPKTKGDSDLDDYDFGEDDEDYDEETEIDDADVMAESEDNS